jgi:hypothetical protein
MKMKNIYGVYFICCIQHYLDIVKEQLYILNKGLLNKTTKLIIFITNYNETECVELDKLLNNEKFILIKSHENLYEKYAINNYKKYIENNDYYLYYFHTKGLKDKNDPLLHQMAERRIILNYYTLYMFNINIELLEIFDAIGINLSFYPKKHFSGNFWWSKSSYLNLLDNINDKYLSPEMYILSNTNCKYISLDNNIYHIYNTFIFPDEDKIKNNITNQFIIINEHQNLLSLCD